MCGSVYSFGQSNGDFRTATALINSWEQVSNWEQFNGTNWIPASEFPGENYSPTTVTILSFCNAKLTTHIWNYPIQNLHIQENSICELQNVHFKISHNLIIDGIFTNESSIGNTDITNIILRGDWIQNQPKTFTILQDLLFENGKISGNALSKFEVGRNLITSNATNNYIDKASLIVNGDSFFNGNIIFTSVSGDKIFNADVFIQNSTWQCKTGELFICKKNLTCINARIENKAFVEYQISENLIIQNSIFIRHLDFFGTFSIQQDLIVSENSISQIESACLTVTGNFEILGTLHITDKKGVKTIFGDFIIQENGEFLNSGNDRIIIHNNVINNGICNNGSNGIFELCGLQNEIRGSLSTPRLQINGRYINTQWLEVKTDFLGNGTVTQAENAILIIQAENSPKIEASAIGNIVKYTKRVNQISNCDTYYTVILANNEHEIYLQQNTTILHCLTFEKACFINCNSYILSFPNWNNTSIQNCITPDRGIILQNGKIEIRNLNNLETAKIPLFHNKTIEQYACIEITNFDSNNTTFTIDSLLQQITSSGISNNETIYSSNFINRMIHISSLSTNAELTFYWHISEELPGFERNLCGIQHYNGTAWEFLDEPIFAEQFENYDIFYISGITHSFSPFSIATDASPLPIALSSFNVIMQNNYAIINWETESETNSDYFTLEKSLDGKNFYPINKIVSKHNSSVTNYYSYIDTDLKQGIQYYKLKQTDFNGTTQEFEIQSIQYNELIDLIITIQNRCITIYDRDKTINSITLYTNQMQLITNSFSNTLQYNNMPHGIYVLEIKKNNRSIWKKILL